MAMIAAFEFHDQLAICCAAGQPDARHRCLRAAVDHPDFFDRGDPGADQSRHLDLERVRNPEAQPALCGFADCFHDDIRSMAKDGGTPGPDVVNVFASFDVPDV